MRSDSSQVSSQRQPGNPRGRFSAGDLDCLLSEAQPMPRVPRDMHESIMRSVQREEIRQARQTVSRPSWLRPIAVAMSLALAVGFLGWSHYTASSHRQIDPALREQLSATWTFIGEFGTNAPVLLTKPLETRFNELTNDLHKTTKTLLASFP